MAWLVYNKLVGGGGGGGASNDQFPGICHFPYRVFSVCVGGGGGGGCSFCHYVRVASISLFASF